MHGFRRIFEHLHIDAHPDRLRVCGKAGNAARHRIAAASECFRRLFREQGFILREQHRRPCDMLYGSGIFTQQQRHDLLPETVPAAFIGEICAVVHIALSAGAEKSKDVRSFRIEQRPPEPSADRQDPAQAAQSAAAQQMKQHRLGLIARMMRGNDHALRRCLFQCLIPQPARRGLQ